MNARNRCGSVVPAMVVVVLTTLATAALAQDVVEADRSLGEAAEDTAGLPPCDWGCCRPCCRASWTAWADFLILARHGGTSQTLVEVVPNTPPSDRVPGSTSFGALFSTRGTEVLNGNDFDPGFRGGPRVGLIRHVDERCDLELLYFQIDGWSSDRKVVPGAADDCLVMRAPGEWISPAATPGGWTGWIQTNQSSTQAMAWKYASELRNAEFNVRWNPACPLSLLAGFRWVNLGEDLQGALDPPTISTEPPFWKTTTSNHLYGLQIGADGRLWERGRFSIHGQVKAGIYDNHAEQTTAVSVIAKQVSTASATTDRVAFVGETGLHCEYRLTNALLLKAGYELIWLEGVALAPGQIQETYTTTKILDNSVRALGVNCDSGVFYHGATLGLEYAF